MQMKMYEYISKVQNFRNIQIFLEPSYSIFFFRIGFIK